MRLDPSELRGSLIEEGAGKRTRPFSLSELKPQMNTDKHGHIYLSIGVHLWLLCPVTVKSRHV
jgi:hypothetical protein